MESGRLLRFGRLAACAVALLTTTCTDDTGPASPIEGRFALLPSYASSVAGIIDIREIRFTLARTNESLAKDTVIQLAPGADSVVLELTVPLVSAGEVFSLVVTLMDADGTVMFGGGPVDVTPGLPGSPPPVIPMTFVYTGPGADAAGVEITTEVSADGILSGDTLRLAAIAVDSAGAPIAGTPIAWRSLDTARALAQADPASSTYGAVVIGGTQRGPARVVAELLTGPTDTTVVGVQPVPAAIVLESGGGQTATIGEELSSPVITRVVASDGLGVGGLWVSYTPSEGSVSNDSGRTDGEGGLSVFWNLGTTAGEQTLTMTVVRFPAVSTTVTATALPGAVATLEVSPPSATLDALGAQVQLTATARDTAGNVVQDAAITWASEFDPVATVDATGLVTAVSEGVIDIFATADTVTVLVPLTVNQVPTSLAFTVQPSDVPAGTPITPPVEVGVLDRLGSVVADAATDVTMVILDNPGGGTLAGTTTVAAVNGVAVFSDLSIDTPAAFYRLEARATGLDIAESDTFDVLAPSARLVSWLNPVDGNWSDGTKWSTGTPPGPGDTVRITVDGSYSVTLDVNDTVYALEVAPNTGTVQFVAPYTLTVDSVATFGVGAVFIQSSNVSGAGNLVVQGLHQWSGGTFTGAGTLRLEAGAASTITGTMLGFDGWDAEIAGTLRWNAGEIFILGGTQVMIEPTGIFDMRPPTQNISGIDGQITNDGLVSRPSGSRIDVATPFINAGTVDVQSGQFIVRRGPGHSGSWNVLGTLILPGIHILSGPVTGSGTIRVLRTAAGDSVIFDGSEFAASALTIEDGTAYLRSSTVAIADSIYLQAGTLTLETGDTVSVPKLIHEAGTLASPAPSNPDVVEVTGEFRWSGGTASGGATIVAPGATAVLDGQAKTLDSRSLHNFGTLTWTGGDLSISLFGVVNEPGGLLDVQWDANVLWLAGFPAIENYGTLRKSAGTGTMNSRPGVWNYAGGTIDIQSGILAPATRLNMAFWHYDGAVIQGTGGINLGTASTMGPINGDFRPGTSPGSFQVFGPLPADTGSVLQFEINGVTAGVDYDQLHVSGQATILGGIEITMGFSPAVGDSFTVMTFGSRGAGSVRAVTGLDLGGGFTLDTVWTATELALVVRAPPAGSIVFAGDSAGGLSTGFFTVNPDGSALTRIHAEATLEDEYIHPRWSPDRERVVFTYRTGGFLNPNSLYLMTALGDSATLLMNDTSAYQPRYSPNGIHVAFACGDGWVERDVCVIPDLTGSLPSLNGVGNGGGKVYVTDFDQVNRRDGTDAFAWDPLNPDRITVVRDSSDGVNPPASRFYTARYDGTDVQPLSPDVMDAGNGALIVVGIFDWSPDGQQLVFPAVDPQGEQDLYVINRDGSGLAALTATSGVWEDAPQWSPTGTEILFARNLGCDFDAWLMNPDGSNARKVTNEAVCDFNTDLLGYDWSPDGQEIVLTGFMNPYDGPLIYKIPRTTVAASYFTDRVLIGRYGSGPYEVRDIQPSWRP